MERMASLNDYIRPHPKQKEALQHIGTGKYVFFGGSRGGGKRVSYDTLVLTSRGWIPAWDVEYADKLVSVDGSYTKILDIHKASKGDMYEVEFEDNVKIKCDGDHNWYVYSDKHGKRNGWQIKTTDQIRQTKVSWSVPLLEKPAPGKKWEGVDPYIVGLILGDGTNSSHYTTVYSPDEYIIKYLENSGFKCYYYEYNKTITMCQCFDERYRDILGRHIGDQKRVPEELLMADPETRLALLQGLMDSDGSADKDGRCTFYSVSKFLVDNVIYLVRSLGGKADFHIVEKETDRGGRGWYYKVQVTHAGKFNPFRMPRKADRVKSKQLGVRNKIISIRKIEDCHAVCFTVDHPSHLYVIDNFVVTHNTEMSLYAAATAPLIYPGIKIGIFRKTYPELEDEIILRYLNKFPEKTFGYKFLRKRNTAQFANGSNVMFRAVDDVKAATKLQGVEFQLIIIDEGPNFVLDAIFKLMGSLRRDIEKFRDFVPTMLITGNPGGQSDNYFKTRFVRPNYDLWEDYELKNKDKYVFVSSGVGDNPNVGEEYTAKLQMLPDYLQQAWLYGNWDSFEGQFFNMWSPTKHIVADFEPPSHWRKIGGLDLGWTKKHPTVLVLLAQNPENYETFVYKEYVMDGVLEQYIRDIKELTEEENLEAIYADPSMWIENKFRYDEESAARMFLREGIMLLPANNKRINGWRVMKNWMNTGHRENPLLRFCESCNHTITTLPSMTFSKGGLKEDADTNGPDDAGDAIRYALVSGLEYPSHFDLQQMHDILETSRTKLREKYIPAGANYG